MQKFFDRLTQALLVAAFICLFALGGAAFLPEAIAAIRNMQPTPTVFADYTGTNWIGFDASAKATVSTGGTIYTGATTNWVGTNATVRLQIVNGIVVGIAPY